MDAPLPTRLQPPRRPPPIWPTILPDDTAKSSQMAAQQIALSIQATSPFSPKEWTCPRCSRSNSLTSPTCTSAKCGGHITLPGCSLLDHRGHAVNPARFPVHWVCSTCGGVHLVLEILTKRVSCACGLPGLRAVYDQFGDIFLLWRDDPAVHDLTCAEKVQEAAWRLWEAGGGPWLADMVATDEAVAKRRCSLMGVR